MSRPPQGKIKGPLTSSRVNHWEIALYSSFLKLVKDIREKIMENNGDEIAVLFLKDMKQSGLHINHEEFRSSDKLRFACG